MTQSQSGLIENWLIETELAINHIPSSNASTKMKPQIFSGESNSPLAELQGHLAHKKTPAHRTLQ